MELMLLSPASVSIIILLFQSPSPGLPPPCFLMDGTNNSSIMPYRVLSAVVVGSLPLVYLVLARWWKRTQLGSNAANPQCRVNERDFESLYGDGQATKGLKHFTTREFIILAALADTFLPSFLKEDVDRALEAIMMDTYNSMDDAPSTSTGYFQYGAVESNLPAHMAQTMENYVPPDLLVQIRLVLRTLDSSMGVFLLTGVWPTTTTTKKKKNGGGRGGFSAMPFVAREKAIISMLTSRIAPLRGAMLGIKAMAGRLYYGTREEASPPSVSASSTTTNSSSSSTTTKKVNPTWKELSYEDRTIDTVMKVNKGKPLPKPKLSMAGRDTSRVFEGAEDHPDVREMECDIVIVGSGAGGGVAAGVLAVAGFKVVVLEAGPYCTEEDFAKFGEAEAGKNLYDTAGWMTTEEMSAQLLAGACVGGGTTINWTASFRTPQHILHEWAQRLGLKSFTGPLYREATDAVCRRVNVNTDHSHRNDKIKSVDGLKVNGSNQSLYEMAVSSGQECLPAPRNVKGCVDCTGCERGCPYGAKQSTMNTFLEDAHATGNLTIYDKAHVDKVIIEDGQAVGVLATITTKESDDNNKEGSSYRLVVHARHAVIASAGSLHTPALLLRSGMKHGKIGRHLSLHPVASVAGYYPGVKMEHYRGVGLGTYVPHEMDMDGCGYGAVIETPPSHAGITGLAVPWNNAFAYRVASVMKTYQAIIIPINRDRSCASNRVVIDSRGKPRVHYMLTKRDSEMVMKSVLYQCRLQKQNRASVICLVREQYPMYMQHKEKEYSFQDFLKWVEERGTPLANSCTFSAHQMGSCRMASSKAEGVVDEEGQTWEASKLYIMDASVFPTSLGINPMVTIQAIAFMLAKKLAHKLKGDVSAVERRYCVASPEEKAGKVCYPHGPTLQHDYGVTCKDKWW